MEEHLNVLRDLLKYSLEENYKIDRDRAPCDLSIIQEYSFQETCEELRFLIETLLTYKKSAKNLLVNKENLRQEHVCLVDLPSHENSELFCNSLRRKLKEIQKKYLEKVENLMNIGEAYYSVKREPAVNFLPPRQKKHIRRASTFRSLNSRHSGSDRGLETEKKLLYNAVASIKMKPSQRPRSTLLKSQDF
jgi:hypothetical protein